MMKSQTGVQRKRRFRLTDDDLWGYAFILVSMIAFGVFTLYPVISAVEIRQSPQLSEIQTLRLGIHRPEELSGHLFQLAVL